MKRLNLNTKYLKTGGYSVLVSVAAIAIIIVINLFAGTLPASWTKLDMSANDMFSIGEQTVELVKGVKDEVTVYYVIEHGSEDSYVETMLDKYGELNSKITVKNIDPALNPNFLTGDRLGIQTGSLIVETEKRSKVITEVDIYYPGYSQDDVIAYYQQTGSLPQSSGFDFENCMTSAINYVTTDILPVVYSLSGHGEIPLSDAYKGYLSKEGFEVKELNLATSEAVPEDCDAVIVSVPEKDISEDEATRLIDYLKKGGKLYYVSYFAYTAENKHTNLDTVLAYYGLSQSKGMIYEGDSSRHYPNAPYMVLGEYGSHEIVNPLNGYYTFLTYCQGINKLEDIRDTVTVTPLLSTSSKAYAKVNLESETVDKEEGDVDGPFDYAVAVSETNEDGSETKVIWMNTPMILEAGYDMYGTYKAMFVNSFGWLCDKEDSISIPAKALEQEYLTVNELQGNFLSVIFTIVIPVVIIAIGFVVWWRRRSR